MDMLAVDPVNDCTVACEYKRLSGVGNAREILADINRIGEFRLQKAKNSLAAEINLKDGERFGVVAATTWGEKYVKWWSDDAPNPSDDKVWDELTDHPLLGKHGKNCLWNSKPMTGVGYNEEMSHLLYLVFRLP